MVVSITAGGASRDEVTSLLAQVTAGLPGFDLDTKVRFAPTRSRALLGLPAGILLAAATLFGLPQLRADIAALIPPVQNLLVTECPSAAHIVHSSPELDEEQP